MTHLVAFDGTALSEAALRRAKRFERQNDERLVAVSVLPTDDVLAEEYGLVDGDEYDPEAAAGRLRDSATDIAPGAEFRAESIDAYAGRRQVATKIRRAARDEDATLVFIGSDDAGRVVKPVSSVGSAVAGTPDYDVFIVRSTSVEE
ncbi:MAG: nucleotide-binding universal stress UspA family protein [Natronomonas sp.]|jgi:nucleotide-binding universal stress UspA family protein|uniref:universal stress protein n=1 Tax=Natronomonas sp. TaxID=2184060 RepID=UPI003989F3E8